MSKLKGFAAPKPEISSDIPVERVEQIATTSARLEELLGGVLQRRLTPRCYGLFKRLAHMPPEIRLAYNLKVVIQRLCDKDLVGVNDGLLEDERAALVEVDASGADMDIRRTAHSLLNVDARHKFIEAFAGTFRDMRTRSQHVLVNKPLDTL